MNEEVRHQLQADLTSDLPLPAILNRLCEWKTLGIPRRDVQNVLGSLRRDFDDETTEDHIVEILDFVDGFCSIKHTIRND